MQAQPPSNQEWSTLRCMSTCMESSARVWRVVAKGPTTSGAHSTRRTRFCITAEKSAELSADNPLRNHTGRVVLQGNDAEDQSWGVALAAPVGIMARV